MHMEGAWLSTTGKKKGKQNFASAEHKRNAMNNKDNWASLIKRWDVKPADKKAMVESKLKPYRRDTGPRLPSLGSDNAGPCVKQDIKVYTGENMVGIAQMAKSNAVPVFRTEDILDISKMRR